ncbi:MAG: NAD(P)/FAD-dependent oxidoreductase [Burkholderiales bacterium]|nr:NAD(P)/FAD-dependent oxidoreductase [Phycisphaerae bacterium]
MAKKHLVIIGHGMAGSRLLDELQSRHAGTRYRITVYGEEPGAAYNRILLSKVLGGADPDTIRMKAETWHPGDDVTLVPRTRVDRIDSANRLLHLSDGSTEPYDIAIIATGSRPFIPKIEGSVLADSSPKPGVFAYRTLDDCLQMRSKLRPGDSAVVLGGGLLGLEAAKALADNGLHVTVCHLMPTLMETQLDETGGKMLQRQIEQQGIFVRCGRTIAAILGCNQVRGVRLDDGTELAADMVVLACGIRPRVDLAQASGIPVNRGVIVNDALATAVPGVYALGECAEHRGRVYGIVTPIWEQCEALADILCATGSARRYTGSKLYSRLKVAGVDVASMGVVKPELASDQTIQIFEEQRATYRKLILREGKLIGAQLVGDTAAAGQLVQLFDRNTTIPLNPLEALCAYSAAGGSTGAALDRQVCNCNTVNESAIVSAIKQGCVSVEAVGVCTRAGTGCGSCRSQIVGLIREHRPAAAATL